MGLQTRGFVTGYIHAIGIQEYNSCSEQVKSPLCCSLDSRRMRRYWMTSRKPQMNNKNFRTNNRWSARHRHVKLWTKRGCLCPGKVASELECQTLSELDTRALTKAVYVPSRPLDPAERCSSPRLSANEVAFAYHVIPAFTNAFRLEELRVQ